MLNTVFLCCFLQISETQGSQEQLAQVVEGLAALEQNMVPFEVECTATWHVLWGQEFEPPLRTEFLIQVDRHAVLVALRSGLDPMDHYAHKNGLRHGPRLKLLKSGGEQEWYDFDSDELSLRENPGMQNPHESMALLTPGPIAWSLGGVYRSRFVSMADWSALTPREDPPGLELRFGNRVSETSRTTNMLAFREDWGWLASEAAILGRVGGEYRAALRGTVHSVHYTRLGPMPHMAEYYGTQGVDDAGRFIPSVHAHLEFANYRLAGVQVPESLRLLDRDGLNTLLGRTEEPAITKPTLPRYEETAFTVTNTSSVESWQGRERQMDTLVAGGVGAQAVITGGKKLSALHRLRGRLSLITAIVLVVAAYCWRKRPYARYTTGLAILSVVVAGVDVAARSDRSGEPAEDLGTPIIPLQGQVSKVLCGVDAVYLAAIVSREAPQDKAKLYTDILRIAAPEGQGTSLANLAIAGECLGYGSEIVRVGDYQQPPSPLVVHINGNHFAVCLAEEANGRLILVDPSRGTFATEWEVVQRMCGPIALWIQ